MDHIYQYIENVDQKMNFCDSDEIEIRLSLYRSFSTIWNSLVVFTLKYLFTGIEGNRGLKAIYVVNSKVIQAQPKYKTRNFQNY